MVSSHSPIFCRAGLFHAVCPGSAVHLPTASFKSLRKVKGQHGIRLNPTQWYHRQERGSAFHKRLGRRISGKQPFYKPTTQEDRGNNYMGRMKPGEYNLEFHTATKNKALQAPASQKASQKRKDFSRGTGKGMHEKTREIFVAKALSGRLKVRESGRDPRATRNPRLYRSHNIILRNNPVLTIYHTASDPA